MGWFANTVEWWVKKIFDALSFHKICDGLHKHESRAMGREKEVIKSF